MESSIVFYNTNEHLPIEDCEIIGFWSNSGRFDIISFEKSGDRFYKKEHFFSIQQDPDKWGFLTKEIGIKKLSTKPNENDNESKIKATFSLEKDLIEELEVVYLLCRKITPGMTKSALVGLAIKEKLEDLKKRISRFQSLNTEIKTALDKIDLKQYDCE